MLLKQDLIEQIKNTHPKINLQNLKKGDLFLYSDLRITFWGIIKNIKFNLSDMDDDLTELSYYSLNGSRNDPTEIQLLYYDLYRFCFNNFYQLELENQLIKQFFNQNGMRKYLTHEDDLIREISKKISKLTS